MHVIGLFNFFSLIIGAGAYINRYKRLNIVELQSNSTQLLALSFSNNRWDELCRFSAFNSYSIGLRSYGLLDNCAGDSQNSYGLTHSVQTGKMLAIKEGSCQDENISALQSARFMLMRKTLIYFPLPQKTVEALNYER